MRSKVWTKRNSVAMACVAAVLLIVLAWVAVTRRNHGRLGTAKQVAERLNAAGFYQLWTEEEACQVYKGNATRMAYARDAQYPADCTVYAYRRLGSDEVCMVVATGSRPSKFSYDMESPSMVAFAKECGSVGTATHGAMEAVLSVIRSEGARHMPMDDPEHWRSIEPGKRAYFTTVRGFTIECHENDSFDKTVIHHRLLAIPASRWR